MLSDDGTALNPSRRGQVGQLVAHMAALGVETITGKPYKPTTQGKDEHPHQGLPGRTTPLTAWQATEKPNHHDPRRTVPRTNHPHRSATLDPHRLPTCQPAPSSEQGAPPAPSDWTTCSTRSTSPTPSNKSSSSPTANQPGDRVIVTDLDGEILAEHQRPATGVRYVGNGRRPGTRSKHPEVLAHQTSPMS